MHKVSRPRFTDGGAVVDITAGGSVLTMDSKPQDTRAQSFSEATGCNSWSILSRENSQLFVLPGAWAMGDGVILETGPPSAAAEARFRSSSAPGDYYSDEAEGISAKLSRIAGSLSSFTSSVSAYFSDHKAWGGDATDAATHDSMTAALTGEIQWVPRSSSVAAVTSKKHD